jgi:hypothetical protein
MIRAQIHDGRLTPASIAAIRADVAAQVEDQLTRMRFCAGDEKLTLTYEASVVWQLDEAAGPDSHTVVAAGGV